jgi:hypothetical protein
VEIATADEGRSRAAFVNADVAKLPVVTIPPGERRAVDLFFPLPESLEEPEDLPAFDVIWRVRADRRTVARRTPFERLASIPEAAHDLAFRLGHAPYRWCDPLLPHHTFVHPTVVLRPPVPPPRRVFVGRPPRPRR